MESSSGGTFSSKERQLLRKLFGFPDKLTLSMLSTALQSSHEFKELWERVVSAKQIKIDEKGSKPPGGAPSLAKNSLRKFLIKK